MICLTTAGDGRLPLWACWYAWMTRAATPAVSGAASLVPPSRLTSEALPAKLLHAENSLRLGVQSVQFRSPGATTSTVFPSWVNPPELRPLMLLPIQPVMPLVKIPPTPVCA